MDAAFIIFGKRGYEIRWYLLKFQMLIPFDPAFKCWKFILQLYPKKYAKILIEVLFEMEKYWKQPNTHQ